MSLLLDPRPRVTQSEPLTVTVRVQVTPADEKYDAEIDFILEKVEPPCACGTEAVEPGVKLCDSCWLEEAVACAGVREVLLGDDGIPDHDCTIILKGRMKCDVRYDAWNGDYDGDEEFEATSWEVIE